jgi:hypothetical protein
MVHDSRYYHTQRTLIGGLVQVHDCAHWLRVEFVYEGNIGAGRHREVDAAALEPSRAESLNG